MRSAVNKIPGVAHIYGYLTGRGRSSTFEGSAQYWESRYASGGNSGAGSYGRLAEYKARVLNKFVAENEIRHVIEFGCGDGNQLRLTNYPTYSGYDVSPAAVVRCRSLFAADATRKFGLMDEYDGESCDLSISLDVIYHLIEDHVFHEYMSVLFSSSNRFVVIYSSCKDERLADHVRHRIFTDWIKENEQNWELVEYKENDFPFISDEKQESFANFYFYKKLAAGG